MDYQSLCPDGILNYSSAVLNDGLLLLELRDGIREGDGERVLRVWKFMLMYWRNARHTKYSYEAICLLSAVATSTPQLAQEIKWCRFVNTRGGLGNNIPVDLCMEHFNRFLKDCLLGLGPNVSERTIVKTSKSLRMLKELNAHFDNLCSINPNSTRHTKASNEKDLQIILEKLQCSRAFEYIPGRTHRSFKDIKPHISQSMDTDRLFEWIRNTQKKLADEVTIRNMFHA
jgi:hypothetical protein